MRRFLQPPGALPQAFPHQGERAVFEIAQAAMQQLGGSAAGLRHRFATLEQHYRMAGFVQRPCGHDAVDAGAYDGDAHW